MPDVCQRVDDAVLVAGLARALVDTAAQEWARGAPAADVPAMVVRAAGWRAARWGLGGDLVDPREGTPRPAPHVLSTLLEHVAPALSANGDVAVVAVGLDRVLGHGNGATRQRGVYRHKDTLRSVVLDAIENTQNRQNKYRAERVGRKHQARTAKRARPTPTSALSNAAQLRPK